MPCSYVRKKLADTGKIHAKTLRQSLLGLSREKRGSQCSLGREGRGECRRGMTYGALNIVIKPAFTLIETGSHRRIWSRGGAYHLMILKDRSGYNGEQAWSTGANRRDQLGREARDDDGPEDDDSSGAPKKWSN